MTTDEQQNQQEEAAREEQQPGTEREVDPATGPPPRGNQEAEADEQKQAEEKLGRVTGH